MNSDTDPVLQLGRDLAEALEPSDVVGRWMSHHLAELITRCEANPNDEELAATTRDVVLKMWERKHGAHFKTEPYAYVGPALRAIARLDPNPDRWTCYRPFGEQVPSDEALATYPLLQKVCDIDREVGQLIRLGVALAAQEATAREEPWVIAGMETAETEEDRAVRALEQLAQRLRLQAGPDPREALAADGLTEPDSADSAALLADKESKTEPVAGGSNLNDVADAVESADPLTAAFGIAVVRCRRLIDRIATLSEELAAAAAVEEDHSGRTEPAARDEQAPEQSGSTGLRQGTTL
ncbi:hypothetical protein E1212_25220 [Jiangella ureilytica]|uniref:Uncharacterized protein n=1 Tax=Jiangella ureilytica TaxID=2530374 RepID=A0A4R4RCT8_9ACTN|nr:hypothetical protein [Jiangella ureilytica]TDC47088.1 hypothetical protein E1212_25220 [Jiangella ureilytica]